jgi:hypothetical protein
MKTSRIPGGHPHRLTAAGAALTVFLLTGCGVFLRPAPPPLDLPTGAALEEHPDQSRAWWDARFRFFWPEDESPRWFLDLLVADRLVKPALIEHRQEIALWRVHRRAARDGAGHQFSLLFYADRETARQIFAALRQAPLLGELKDAGMIDSIVFDDTEGDPETDPGATSDPHWSPELRTAWPYYIMGVSAMWLELIHQFSGSEAPPDRTAAALAQYYRELDRRLTRVWEEDAQHALLHHLNAIFEYRPMMIQKRMRF